MQSRGAGSVMVGAPGPAVSCTETLSAGADIQSAVRTAKAGDVICLSAGTYGDVTFEGISHSGNVTLAAAPRAAVHLGHLSFVGPQTSGNLTVQGLYIDSGVSDRTGTPGGLVFQYNTIKSISQGYAFYFYAGGSTPGRYMQNGVQMLYNEIDHVGACLEIDGGADMAANFTFSHNVCGPGIGAGATSVSGASHYIQVGGITGLTADNNAFLGPMDPRYESAGLHNNVLHVFGDARRVGFSSNLLWHTQSRGQTILLEQGRVDDVAIANNLDVEDPACDVGGGCAGYAIDVYASHRLTIEANTIVGSYWGVLLAQAETGSYSAANNYVVRRNVVVGAKGNAAISYRDCGSTCLFDYNVTDDASARAGGGTHHVTKWAAAWRATSWTPRLPYVAPPAGYYTANGVPWAAGYHGRIGP